MEKLAALFVLRGKYLCIEEDYQAELDKLFLENPEDDLLLELEMSGKGCDSWYEGWEKLAARISDHDLVEKELFKALGNFYGRYCILPGEYHRLYKEWGFRRLGEYLEETGKITLFQFAERIFDLHCIRGLKIKNPLEKGNFFNGFVYEWRDIDMFPESYPEDAEEQCIKEYIDIYRTVFDRYKEKS